MSSSYPRIPSRHHITFGNHVSLAPLVCDITVHLKITAECTPSPQEVQKQIKTAAKSTWYSHKTPASVYQLTVWIMHNFLLSDCNRQLIQVQQDTAKSKSHLNPKEKACQFKFSIRVTRPERMLKLTLERIDYEYSRKQVPRYRYTDILKPPWRRCSNNSIFKLVTET